jgi:hypothetical protein
VLPAALLVVAVHRHKGHLHPCLSGVQPNRERWSAFYLTRGRLSAYCKDCQRAKSAAAYHRRRKDPSAAALMRDRDRRRKRLERARAAALDPERERRNGRVRTAAVRRLIAAHRTEYRALLHQERQRQEGDDG